MTDERADPSTRLTGRSSKEEPEPEQEGKDEAHRQPRADRRDKRKLSTISRDGEPKTKRIKLKSQRKKSESSSSSSSKEKSESLLHGARQRGVIRVVAEENIPNIVDLTDTSGVTLEEPCWLKEREKVAKSLSRMIKVQSTAREFITSDNIYATIYVKGEKTFLGHFFFASTNSDVVAMTEDFERAGYICNPLHRELLLSKSFQKALPQFQPEEKVISVFSQVNVKLEDVQTLLGVSKHTRLLTFSKEAFILFKTVGERDQTTKRAIEYTAEILFDGDHLRFFKLYPPELPPLNKFSEHLKTRPDSSKILVLTPLFIDRKIKNFDPKM